jgi:hypothetical protein
MWVSGWYDPFAYHAMADKICTRLGRKADLRQWSCAVGWEGRFVGSRLHCKKVNFMWPKSS